MHYLIDGYNLLHVTDVFSNAVGSKSLPKLHSAFLDCLASLLGPEDASRTTVVFDARGRSATSRRTIKHEGITVHYASNVEDADNLIAELIGEHHFPRQLTVVSSDHQVQRAAKRRRANAVDSGPWYADLVRKARAASAHPQPEKPSEAVALQDAQWWLAQFDDELLRELGKEDSSPPPASPKKTRPASGGPRTESKSEQGERKVPAVDEELATRRLEDGPNPFPPEYIAEVIRELEEAPKRIPKRRSKGSR